ncbi:MAG: carboxypeptidase-like regulatory domain-containing protein [Planctomycetota bacterium]
MRADKKWIVAALAALIGWLAYLLVDLGAPDASGRVRAESLGPGAAEVVGAPTAIERETVVQPEPRDAPSHGELQQIPEHSRLRRATVQGRVVDTAGTPVGSVQVRRSRPRGLMPNGSFGAPTNDAWSVVADAAGHFEADGLPPFVLSVHDETFATVFEGYVDSATEQVLVVVALRIPVGGVVVDRSHAPIAGVRITYGANESLPGLDLTGSRLVVPEAHSDAQGLFRLENAVAVAGAHAQFQAAGYATCMVPLPAGGDPAMTVVMSSDVKAACTITGHVVLEDGSPAVGAFVSLGRFMASSTDARGFFVIDFEPWLSLGIDEAAPLVVTAVLAGLRPVSRTLPSVREVRTSGWPEPIVLRLVGAPLSISGVVVDEENAPVGGVLVEPADMTEFGVVPQPNMPASSGIPKTQEQLAGGTAVETGADGRFELRGLLDRSYTIRALQNPSLLSAVSTEVAAGSQGVRIVLGRKSLGTVAGRVVDRGGQGIGGVRVAVSFERTSELVIGRGAVTAADGTFAIAEVTTTPAFLRIEGATIVPELFHKLGPSDDIANLELRVGLRRRLQFDWGAQLKTDDRLVVVDAAGEELMMMRLNGGSIGQAPYLNCNQGLSEVVAVADAAAFAVVQRGGREVTRVRLQLAADGVNLIRL